jgi:hypothetical protein
MSKVIIKGNKRVIALSILNKTYYVNLYFVNAVGLKHFNTKSSFENLEEDIQTKIKQYIRDLVINKEHISNQIIEENILSCFLPKNIQKELNILDKCQ